MFISKQQVEQMKAELLLAGWKEVETSPYESMWYLPIEPHVMLRRFYTLAGAHQEMKARYAWKTSQEHLEKRQREKEKQR